MESGHSRIIIYKENIDNIIGYVHSIELFKTPISIKSMLIPISIVPESISGIKLLEDFIDKKISVSVVVDEYGGTSGILTMEDIIEEIFGEIDDEHDQEELIHRELTKNKFRITLTQGLNRQIRRMCEHLNYSVVQLRRVRIMNIPLDVKVGKWRNLSKTELKELNFLISNSSKINE